MGDHGFDPCTIGEIKVDKAVGAIIRHPVYVRFRRFGNRQIDGFRADGENGRTIGDGKRKGEIRVHEVSV
ncbi:hypothetical protein D3C78_672070 [compost metagenome]